MSREPRGKSFRRLFLVVLVMGVVAAACSSTSESSQTLDATGGAFTGGENPSPETTEAPSEEARSETAEGSVEFADIDTDELGTGGIAPAVLRTSNVGRDIIFTAD